MKTIYVADDGEQFDSLGDCVKHEVELQRSVPIPNNMHFYDVRGQELTDFTEQELGRVQYIKLDDEAAVEAVYEFGHNIGLFTRHDEWAFTRPDIYFLDEEGEWQTMEIAEDIYWMYCRMIRDGLTERQAWWIRALNALGDYVCRFGSAQFPGDEIDSDYIDNLIKEAKSNPQAIGSL